MSVVLDAGALIALERDDRAIWIRLAECRKRREPAVTHAGVVGQVWRGGARQARLAVALTSMDIRPLDLELAKRAGELLRKARAADVIDSAVVALAHDGDVIVTSDPQALRALARAADLHVELVGS